MTKIQASVIRKAVEKTDLEKLRKKSKFLDPGLDEDPVINLDSSKFFTDIGKLDPEYYELEYRHHGITRCTKAYVKKLMEIKPILMPALG
jgi:hypothetical protein